MCYLTADKTETFIISEYENIILFKSDFTTHRKTPQKFVLTAFYSFLISSLVIVNRKKKKGPSKSIQHKRDLVRDSTTYKILVLSAFPFHLSDFGFSFFSATKARKNTGLCWGYCCF